MTGQIVFIALVLVGEVMALFGDSIFNMFPEWLQRCFVLTNAKFGQSNNHRARRPSVDSRRPLAGSHA